MHILRRKFYIMGERYLVDASILPLVNWAVCLRPQLDSCDDVEDRYAAALRVLRCPTFRAVSYSQGFRMHGVKLNGLTKQLEAMFHPIPMNIATHSQKDGSRRGMIVDRELAMLVNEGRMPADGMLSGFTINVLKALRRRELCPFACQVNVGDTHLCIGTALDIVAVDLRTADLNNVVNIQLKTGFHDNYDKVKKRAAFRTPFVKFRCIQRLPYSYRSMHLLQVIAEHSIVQINHDKVLATSVVLVVRTDSLTDSNPYEWVYMPKNFEHIAVAMRMNLQMRSTVSDHEFELEAAKYVIDSKLVGDAVKGV